LDWFLADKLTVVVGRFLTPFGIYNERLHPGWIRSLPEEPLAAVLEMSDSNGAMVRGGAGVTDHLAINYAAYVSTPSARTGFLSNKSAGGRASVFLPGARLEIGGSYQRQLSDNVNGYGMDVMWHPTAIPLDLRGEAARNVTLGSGYWVEGVYHLGRAR